MKILCTLYGNQLAPHETGTSSQLGLVLSMEIKTLLGVEHKLPELCLGQCQLAIDKGAHKKTGLRSPRA